jgi:hypothetical protein
VIAESDPSSSNIIIQKNLNRENKLTFSPFDVYNICIYYAELIGKKEVHRTKLGKISGKIIIKELGVPNILYEKIFEIPLEVRKIRIHGNTYNVITNESSLIEFCSKRDFFLKSWKVVPEEDMSKKKYLYPHKKYQMEIDFDQDMRKNSFLIAVIMGDIDCSTEQKFERVK